MYRSDWEAVLDAAGLAALDHLNSLPDRPVYPQGSYPEILAALDHPPTDTGIIAIVTMRVKRAAAPTTPSGIENACPRLQMQTMLRA